MTCRTSLRAILLIAILATAPAAAPAQSVCRPNALGATGCLGPDVPPPMPRPLFAKRKPGLEKTRSRSAAGDAAPDLIPGWRQNELGIILLGRGEGSSGRPCRTDSLGNLICP